MDNSPSLRLSVSPSFFYVHLHLTRLHLHSAFGHLTPLHQSWYASAMTVVFESAEIEYTDACIVL